MSAWFQDHPGPPWLMVSTDALHVAEKPLRRKEARCSDSRLLKPVRVVERKACKPAICGKCGAVIDKGGRYVRRFGGKVGDARALCGRCGESLDRSKLSIKGAKN